MPSTLLSILLLLILAASSLASFAQSVQTSAGSVEFLGLEKWTPAEIQRRLGYGSSDRLHYCAADLKSKLGFPEVSVIGYRENGERQTIVTVVEPEHAADVAYRARPTEEVPLPKKWQSLMQMTSQPGFLEGGILDYGRNLPGALTDRDWLSDGTPQNWWVELRSWRGQQDLQLAHTVLLEEDDHSARALAAIVLMNFASDDGTWRSLVAGLRDPDSLVQAVCSQALNSLATYFPRTVDWAPSVSDLGDLLRGTDLFAFSFVLKALTVTNISPTLARPLLGHGGARLILAYLHANHDKERTLAHGFLAQISGRDVGADPATWEIWVRRLRE